MSEPRIYSLRAGSEPAPPDAIYVGRPNPRRADCPDNPWKNPFKITGKTSSETSYNRYWACIMFEEYALDRLREEPDWLKPLRGKSLICWCYPLKCHAETLLRLAN